MPRLRPDGNSFVSSLSVSAGVGWGVIRTYYRVSQKPVLPATSEPDNAFYFRMTLKPPLLHYRGRHAPDDVAHVIGNKQRTYMVNRHANRTT